MELCLVFWFLSTHKGRKCFIPSSRHRQRLYRCLDVTTQDLLKKILSRVKELQLAYMEIKGENQTINGTARQKQNYKTHTNLHPEKRRACLLASIPVPMLVFGDVCSYETSGCCDHCDLFILSCATSPVHSLDRLLRR